MELEIIERLENDSKLNSGYDFVSKNKSISVPYLTFLSFLTIVGTVGNFLVLGTLLIVKVSHFEYYFSQSDEKDEKDNVNFVSSIMKRQTIFRLNCEKISAIASSASRRSR